MTAPTFSPAARGAPLFRRRAAVIDIAFSRLEMAGKPGLRVSGLVDAIADGSVLVSGVRRPNREAWAMALGEILATGRPPMPDAAGRAPALVLAHPASWEAHVPMLTEALADAAARFGVHDISLAPRAALLAESHMESSAQICAIVECHPTQFECHRVTRGAQGWQIESSQYLAYTDGAAVERFISDDIEAVIVDAEERDRASAAIHLFEDHTPTGRVLAAERVLLHRFGGRVLEPPVTEVAPYPGRRAPEASRRTAVVGGVVAAALVVALVIAVVVAAPWRGEQTPSRAGGPTSAPAAYTSVALGRATLEVPATWTVTKDAADAKGAIPFATVAARGDDRRLIVRQFAVRLDSTLASVATSISNRIAQSASTAATEFSPSTTFAGRTVISYRETPGSGAPIRWYVVVGAALQVSVGCQPGSGGQQIDAECEKAVATVQIAPLN
ncbi:type VII secretion-associated protein [Williamsia sp. CHRR-6]|uniref:type VII secretion-associated protein n=1 Tax=Williamsia sp. CHRR-6 TaxID=2835871 RepID=UPI001BDAF145|nr:type VII secretion-associated protein [Williamsia sp. CHRR-6]MBT0566738.1 type VII secretion-associated protein [Williamsia sp. CHRR-6]